MSGSPPPGERGPNPERVIAPDKTAPRAAALVPGDDPAPPASARPAGANASARPVGTNADVAVAVADAHRREWAFVLAATIRITRDLDLAEECVQDSYAQNLTT